MGDISTLLGKRIKELRKTQKMTQAQLAEAIDMETTNLCKLENGGQIPKEENMQKIANVLHVEVKDLFDFEYLKPIDTLKEQLVSAIQDADDSHIRLYYRLFNSLK